MEHPNILTSLADSQLN